MRDETLTMLADSAAAFARAVEPSSASVWRGMAEQGWLGMLVPEPKGGLELGLGHAGQVSRALGKAPLRSPFAAALIAIRLLQSASVGDRLEEAIAGARIYAAALPLPGVELPTIADEGRLSTRLHFISPAAAEVVLVPALLRGEPVLLQVARAHDDVASVHHACPDGSELMRLDLNMQVTAADVVLSGSAVLEAIDAARAIGLNLLAAELLGLMDGALEMTLGYLRTRVQFGKPIGSFQALQHRAVDIWAQRQVAEAAVLGAAASFDANDAGALRAAIGAKWRASEAARHLVTQALQLHGAIGFAEEYGLGAFFNRVMNLSMWFGDPAALRREYGRTSAWLNGIAAEVRS